MTTPIDFQALIPAVAAESLAPRFRLGVVSTINADRTINVTVGGSSTVVTNIKYLAAVQPVPGSPVWLVSDGMDMFAFGVQAADTRTYAPRASRSTTQSIANTTDEAVVFDAVANDAWGSWSAGQASRLTAKITGRYMAVGQVHFAGNATGFRAAFIERTGTSTVGRTTALTVGGGNPTWLNVTSHVFDMTADTDYIRLIVWQNSGGALNLNQSSTFSPALSLIYLGP